MLARHDFLHPYLYQRLYYDKPLLSYWLMASIAATMGQVTAWSLRLPSVLAGLTTLWCTYRLGSYVQNKSLGLLSGWLLLTTYFFFFWARVSGADMLNLAGSLLAIVWYLEKRESPSFVNLLVFFIILALTSLCKGLAVIPLFAIIIHIALSRTHRRYVKLNVCIVMILAIIPACFIYLLPFILSHHGLYLVYRENILRYFYPFDHRGHVYTYFLYLPIYLLPYSLFFFAALYTLPKRWSHLSLASRWIVYTLVGLFLLMTFSGSRRSYYVLPLLPFAICMTADWISQSTQSNSKRASVVCLTMVFSFIILFTFTIIEKLYYDIVDIVL